MSTLEITVKKTIIKNSKFEDEMISIFNHSESNKVWNKSKKIEHS